MNPLASLCLRLRSSFEILDGSPLEWYAYSANALNQYSAITAAGTTTNPAYDSNGNLVTLGANAAYDSESRLVRAEVDVVVTTFAHDPRGRVVTRTINDVASQLVYDDWSLVEDHRSVGTLGGDCAKRSPQGRDERERSSQLIRDATGALERFYVHGAAIDEVLAQIDATGPLYFHQDALGSTVLLTDETGAAVESYSYDAFGTATGHDPATGASIPDTALKTRFLFTGRELLAEAKLYDYRHRAYSPALGRFLQTDPIRFAAGDFNIYRYVSNNPINLWDPMGLCSDDPLLQDPDFQKLINDIWNKSIPFGLSGVGFFGAREHYGFFSTENGKTTTSGPFPSKTPTGGYQPQHQTADPAGTVAGVHSHWTNNPNASSQDKEVASSRDRPEYIVTKDGITRVSPDGTSKEFNWDGSAKDF